MTYYFLKYCMTFVLRLFFRKITIANKANYPSKGPVILAAMHPNSFIDDMTLGAFTNRKLTFLARGDVFSSKFNRFLLKQMSVAPIYRAMDNAKDVKKNIDALDSYSQKLKKGKVILIHSEGLCVVEKRVRKIRKGTARIAFAAEAQSDFKLGLKIVPVSMNYSDAPKIRERVMIDYAEPIELKKYEALYKENPAKAMLEFNNELYAALVSKSIHLESKDTDEVANQCLEITVNNCQPSALPILDNDNTQLRKEKQLSGRINTLYSDNKEVYNRLKALTDKYSALLKQNKLKDDALIETKNIALKSVLLFLILPVFSITYILNVLPVFLGRQLADKVVKTDEFYSSVYVSTSWFFGLIHYLILGILISAFTPFYGTISIFCIAFTGFWAVLLRDKYIALINYFKYEKAFKRTPQIKAKLLSIRNEIIDIIE